MNIWFTVTLMIFCHIVDDYYLQGWLASAKQKEWWQKNAPQSLYKYDYIWALIMHSFSWAFMVMLPIAYTQSFEVNTPFMIVFGANMVVHAIVDDLKADKHEINLWNDQIVHMIQIFITAYIFLVR